MTDLPAAVLTRAISLSSMRVCCFKDVRDIIADDEALQSGILPSLEQYNLEQFITADVPGCDYQVRLPFLVYGTRSFLCNAEYRDAVLR